MVGDISEVGMMMLMYSWKEEWLDYPPPIPPYIHLSTSHLIFALACTLISMMIMPPFICHLIYSTLNMPPYICHLKYATLYIYYTLYMPPYICHFISAILYMALYKCCFIYATLFLPPYICHLIYST